MLEINGLWPKYDFTPIFPNTHQNKQKKRFFDDFSNFLQALKYCSGYQNSLNEAYLKGSG